MKIFPLPAMILLGAAPAMAQPVIVPLPPRGTFLRANQDTVTPPQVRTLSSLNIAPGDRIRIRVLGEYVYNTAQATTHNSVAVFSSTDTLLASTLQQRVPGAIEAGVDFVSAPTFRGALPTDIPQDFRLGDGAGSLDVQVVVPPGAAFLFLGIYDSLYEDNTDTDGDFAAEVTLLCAGDRCCGSADFNCDGDVGTDADIESFFSCLGGSCPPAPCTSSADFNADGDVGTDADIEAFFRVLAGSSC